MADNTTRKTVVIADYDFGDVDIERSIIEAAGLRLVAAQCKSEDDVIGAARDADAIIAQYATVSAKAIDALTRCEVIAGTAPAPTSSTSTPPRDAASWSRTCRTTGARTRSPTTP